MYFSFNSIHHKKSIRNIQIADGSQNLQDLENRIRLEMIGNVGEEDRRRFNYYQEANGWQCNRKVIVICQINNSIKVFCIFFFGHSVKIFLLTFISMNINSNEFSNELSRYPYSRLNNHRIRHHTHMYIVTSKILYR